jgi:hypothetical protein
MNTPSKLSVLIAKAFSNATEGTWHTPPALPSGMNWAVRFDSGQRQIACWRTAQTQASDTEAETMARHAGFSSVGFELIKNEHTGITAIYATEGVPATPPTVEIFTALDRSRLIQMLTQAAQHSGKLERQKYLESLNDNDLIADAQNYTGGRVWEAFKASKGALPVGAP